jgi:hypothetical protein
MIAPLAFALAVLLCFVIRPGKVCRDQGGLAFTNIPVFVEHRIDRLSSILRCILRQRRLASQPVRLPVPHRRTYLTFL